MKLNDSSNLLAPYWYNATFLHEVLRGIPNDIRQILRQTYDKFGTCFPTLDHQEVILGVNVQNCWCNTLSLTVKQAIYGYGHKAIDRKTQRPILRPFDDQTDKYTNPQQIADKLCFLNML